MTRRLGRGFGLLLLAACLAGCPVVEGLASGIAVAALLMATMVVVLVATLELTLVLLAMKLQTVGRSVAAVLGLLLGGGHLVAIAWLLREEDFWGTEAVALVYTSVLAGGCVVGCIAALVRMRAEDSSCRRAVAVGALVGTLSAGGASAVMHRAHDPWRQVPATAVAQVDVARSFGCARHVDGVVTCWTHAWPVVVEGVSHAVDIVVDAQGGCALDEQGQVSCWEGGPPTKRLRATAVAEGALGMGIELDSDDSTRPRVALVTTGGQLRLRRPHPAARVETSLPAEFLALTRVSRCVGTRAGEIACTSGGVEPEWTFSLPDLAQLKGGSRHVCARTRAGEVWCWGDNAFGQLGLGDLESHSDARRVPLPEPARVLTVNEDGACVVSESGAPQCWGRLGSSMLEDPGHARACKRSKLLGDVWCVPSPSRLRW